MKIDEFPDDGSLNFEIQDKISSKDKEWLKQITDHVWFLKSDVNFDCNSKK